MNHNQMKVRVLTREGIDEVIDKVNKITFSSNLLLIYSEVMTFQYNQEDILFYQIWSEKE